MIIYTAGHGAFCVVQILYSFLYCFFLFAFLLRSARIPLKELMGGYIVSANQLCPTDIKFGIHIWMLGFSLLVHRGRVPRNLLL